MQRHIYHLIGKEQGNVKAGREQDGHTLFTQQWLRHLAGAKPFGQAGILARPSVYFYKSQGCLSAAVMKSPPPESFWEASMEGASTLFLLEKSHSNKQLQVGQIQAPMKLLSPPGSAFHSALLAKSRSGSEHTSFKPAKPSLGESRPFQKHGHEYGLLGQMTSRGLFRRKLFCDSQN